MSSLRDYLRARLIEVVGEDMCFYTHREALIEVIVQWIGEWEEGVAK